MIANRRDDDVRLAVEQPRHHSGHNQFDDASFVHHAPAGIDRSDVSLATQFAGIQWQVPP
jgi:isopentenyl-diphosphate delta-isomerase